LTHGRVETGRPRPPPPPKVAVAKSASSALRLDLADAARCPRRVVPRSVAPQAVAPARVRAVPPRAPPPLAASITFGSLSRFSVLSLDEPGPVAAPGVRVQPSRAARAEAPQPLPNAKRRHLIGPAIHALGLGGVFGPARSPDPSVAPYQYLLPHEKWIPGSVDPLPRKPFTKKFKLRPAVVDLVPSALITRTLIWEYPSLPDGSVDLGAEQVALQVSSAGPWAVQHVDDGVGLVLSRQFTDEELSRNCSRVDGMGMCGFLALEWASRCADGKGNGLNLRVPSDAHLLGLFLRRLVAGCTQATVKRKCEQVLAHLLESSSPWTSPRSDGL